MPAWSGASRDERRYTSIAGARRMVAPAPLTRWTIPADLSALIALKNNRDRIFLDSTVGQTVISGAERRALERNGRSTTNGHPSISADDVAAAMRAANLEFRTTEYVSTIVAWVKPEAVFEANWGD